MEAEILAAMKRIKFVEAEARRRLLEEEKKKTEAKVPKPVVVKKPKEVEVPKPSVTKVSPEAEAPKAPKKVNLAKGVSTPKAEKAERTEKAEASKPKKQAIPHSIKTLVWNVHIGEKVAEAKCLCCKVTSISIRHFHCGHYISEKNGGDLSVANLRPICANCNLSMGAMNMGDFIKKFGLHK